MPPRSKARPKMTWYQAWKQAQAEMIDPKSVIWLGPDIARVIWDQEPDVPSSPVSQDRVKSLRVALLLAGLMLVPAAVSYLQAYRRILSAPLR
jgi:hypothetical protein